MKKNTQSPSKNLSNNNPSSKPNLTRRAAIGKMLGLTAGSLVAVSVGPDLVRPMVVSMLNRIKVPKRYRPLVKGLKSIIPGQRRHPIAKG